MIQIGIQGAEGSFSEQAAKKFVENQKIKKYSIKYLISSDGVLNAVQNEKVDYGIFAMENAQGGVVLESVEALCKYTCKIVEMFHIPIKQNLLGKKVDLYALDIYDGNRKLFAKNNIKFLNGRLEDLDITNVKIITIKIFIISS